MLTYLSIVPATLFLGRATSSPGFELVRSPAPNEHQNPGNGDHWRPGPLEASAMSMYTAAVEG